jgi:hypothetical protein
MGRRADDDLIRRLTLHKPDVASNTIRVYKRRGVGSKVLHVRCTFRLLLSIAPSCICI